MAFLLIIAFYPFFYIVNLLQIICEVVNEEGLNILMPFTELMQGVKLVFLFPCLMAVDNSQYYMETAKIKENDPHMI